MRTLYFLIFHFLVMGAGFCQVEKDLNYTGTPQTPNGTDVSISSLEWLAGHWIGEGMGGTVEEIWSPASAGTMMGAFKFIRDSQVQFYELLTISEFNGSLMMRLKHFDSNLLGWEEKGEVVEFPFIEITDSIVAFEGLTFVKVSAQEMNVYVEVYNGKSIITEKLHYRNRSFQKVKD